MPAKRTEISAAVRAEIRMLVEQGISYRSIANKFKCGTGTITRIARENPEETTLSSVPRCSTKARKTGRTDERDVIRGHETDLKKKELKIASVALGKALELFESINITNMPEAQKATSGAILIDKYRLITGQANSIHEHREIQVTALRLLDERKKAEKGKIIDIRPDEEAAQQAPAERPAPADAPDTAAQHTGAKKPNK